MSWPCLMLQTFHHSPWSFRNPETLDILWWPECERLSSTLCFCLGIDHTTLSFLCNFYKFFKEKLSCHVSLSFCLFPWSVPTSLTGSPCNICMSQLSHDTYIGSICLFTGLSLQDKHALCGPGHFASLEHKGLRFGIYLKIIKFIKWIRNE